MDRRERPEGGVHVPVPCYKRLRAMDCEIATAPAATTTRCVPEGVTGIPFRDVPSIFRRALRRSRWTLGLLALLVCLALLPSAPAEAQTTVWSATLTVDKSGTVFGWYASAEDRRGR